MTSIEIPENIKTNAERVLAGRENFISSTVELAEFILGLNKPKIEAEPFVIYRVNVRGEDSNYLIGFRVEKDATYSWITLNLSSPEKKDAYPVSIYSVGVHRDEEIEVLERWTPEPVFGIGTPDDDVDQDREVLIKGTLNSSYVDSDGDVRVVMGYSQGLTETHYISAEDVAYAREAG